MKTSSLYIFCFCIITGLISCTGEQPPEENTLMQENDLTLPDRPNIIWLVAEDLSEYLPMYGDSTISVPTLERLAAEGVTYDYFFSPHPVCAPARAAIITGMYANAIGASHMRTGPWYTDTIPDSLVERITSQYFPEGLSAYGAIPPADVKMFPEYLRKNGYYCTNNAKEDYQFRKIMTAWDESSGEAHWRNRPEGAPFFSVFNFEVTHESRIWSKAADSLWVDDDLEVPVPPYLPDTEIAKKDIRRMYSNIKEMDHQVGEILAQLEEDGLLDNTIVFWYTDHGGMLPRQKRVVFDSGIKVPLIIRFPGAQQAGTRDDRMISFIDLAPTVLSLAGIRPPEYIHGKAFLGEFERRTEPEFVFGAADRFDGLYDHIRFARNKNFKYIRNYNPDQPVYLDVAYRKQMPIMQELLRLRETDGLTKAQSMWFLPTKAPEELYDLTTDPFELNNLAANPNYADTLTILRNAMDEWLAGFTDTGLRPETELLAEFWPDGEQPVTDDPEIRKEEDKYVITTETKGASVGYKIIDPNKPIQGNSWTIYQGPITVPDGMELVAVADRIGYRRSEEIRMTTN